MKRQPISILIIAHNEEDNLPRCLDSVAGWAEEIVAVINNCTDRTEEILKSYQAKVLIKDGMGMGLQNVRKNHGLEATSCPWILNLDADEVCTEELKKNIESFIENDAENYSGGYCPRLSFFMGKWIKHGDWYPDYNLRLFKKEVGTFKGSYGHDYVDIQGPTKKLKGHLLHYSYPNTKAMLRKIASFSDAFLEYQLDHNKKFSPTKTAFRALWRFFRCYIVRGGFLDGFAGLYIAVYQGYITFFRYSRLFEHNQDHAKR